MSHETNAESRRRKFTSAPQPFSGLPWPILFASAVLILVIVGVIVSRAGSPDPAEATAAAADLAIDARQLADGQARFYTYRASSGREVRFFVMKSGDGVIRAALDACDVCYQARQGYRQVGDAMLCNKCGRTFPSKRINEEEGGCNPVPVEREVAGDRVIVRAASLERGASYF